MQCGVAQENGTHHVSQPAHEELLVLQPSAEEKCEAGELCLVIGDERVGRALVRGAGADGGRGG
eukprot:scaffold82559_cov29-Tisochrysis_lutea.AAC.3